VLCVGILLFWGFCRITVDVVSGILVVLYS
jgi:hypothetical protein